MRKENKKMTPNPLETRLAEPGTIKRLQTAIRGKRFGAASFGAEGKILNTEGEPTEGMKDLDVFLTEIREMVKPFAHAVRGTIFVGGDMVHLMLNLQPVGVSDLKLPSVDIHWMPPMEGRVAYPEEGEIPSYRICTFNDTQIQVPSLSDLVMIVNDQTETVRLIVEDESHVRGYVTLVETLGLRIPIPKDGSTQFSISSMAVDRV